MDYSRYQHLLFKRRPNGVLLITINRPEKYNATNSVLHRELSEVWTDLDADDQTRAVVITGAGKAFSAGGDFEVLDAQAASLEPVLTAMEEARNIIYGMINCKKIIISAINGVAVGAGLSVAILADISVIGENVKLTDGHIRLGVAAGDHATLIWPLLCGMAKTKYWLLTADFITGVEAERSGLVSRCVPDDKVLEESLAIADKIGRGPVRALQYTKRSLNYWLQQAGPIFEASLALEMLNFADKDIQEGIAAVKERREPDFPSTH